MGERVIEVSGLTKYYGELLAVDHISFGVRRGEIFGFLGPNGAGKTTTIRMLVGLTRPSEGTATIDGYDIREEIVKIKRRVGVVPETSNLYDELTVWENLLYMARLYRVPRVERGERVRELLETFDLWERRDTKFRRLSKGLKRRATVAAALVHRPSILFLDEPTTGLDVVSAGALRGLMMRLREMGVTVFLTTHYIEEADQLCDRVAVIVKGKIVAVDTPENMKSAVQGTPVLEFTFDSPIPSMGVKGLDLGATIVEGNKMRVLTEDPSSTLEAVIKLTRRHGLRIELVNTLRPSLEDAFVKLTGVSPELMRVEKERGR
ncbi:ATP-binding cassette domain-containing protein [Candidatus Bathyarchaeota archaeon]|nr:ATP-binding cassette domain-containing protein [Candidatus Bathyarchaeota archaeon]